MLHTRLNRAFRSVFRFVSYNISDVFCIVCTQTAFFIEKQNALLSDRDRDLDDVDRDLDDVDRDLDDVDRDLGDVDRDLSDLDRDLD